MNERTNSILMVRPYDFGYNKQTSYDNYYQKLVPNTSLQALKEFDQMVDTLRNNGIDVHVFLDDNLNHTPDSVFPNNWISLHHTGEVCLFPMLARNRRLERKPEVFSFLEVNGFQIDRVIDYSYYELENIFLEGTGSIILDRKNKIAYCSVSKRSNEDLFFKFCKDFEFLPIIFSSFQSVNNKRLPIYHTNVMMCLGDCFSVICLETIYDQLEKVKVLDSLEETNKEVIEITATQMNNFAGNMLQVIGANNSPIIVMSHSAFDSLNKSQLKKLEKFGEILFSNLSTIENYGGGSARCMMAELFY